MIQLLITFMYVTKLALSDDAGQLNLVTNQLVIAN